MMIRPPIRHAMTACLAGLACVAGGCEQTAQVQPWTLSESDVRPLDDADSGPRPPDTPDLPDADPEDADPECDRPSDCPSGVCRNGTCVDPTCDDGVQNGDETDVDCGGPTCPGCRIGDRCRRDRDCQTATCSGPDGQTCARCPAGEERATPEDCGYQNRGTRVEVCRNLEWETDSCRDVWFASCREIARARPDATSGTYTIDPDGPSNDEYDSLSVRCDMQTDGGGWTRITRCLARQTFDGTLVSVTRAEVSEGFDDGCRPATRDGEGRHDSHYSFDFPAGFSEFYLENYAARANAARRDTSELGYRQQTWDRAATAFDGGQGGHDGDISFGVASAAGPVTSFSRVVSPNRNDPECGSCVIDWTDDGRIFDVGRRADTFRIGWGETGPQSEGWLPWWRGSIWLR